MNYMKESAEKYGFSGDPVDEHERQYAELEEELPYTAETFAMFNAREMKSQSKPEQSVKLGKVVPDDTFARIVREINQYEKMSDFYADEKAVASVLGQLRQVGAINDRDLPELLTGHSLSAQGKELIENVLIGKAFQSDPDAVRKLISMPSVKTAVVMSLNELTHNRTLEGEGYGLSDELSRAIDLVYRAKGAEPDVYTQGVPVSPFGRQAGLFDDEYGGSKVTDGVVLLLSDILNSNKPSDLRKVLATYNKEATLSVSGSADMFTGSINSKEDILKLVKEHFKNATPKEQQAIVDAAVEERKRRAAGQGAAGQTSEQAENAPQRGATGNHDGRDVGGMAEGSDNLSKGEAEGELANSKLEERRAKIRKILGTKYGLSDEPANNGELFYSNEKGSTILAQIPEGIFERLGLSPVPFKLTESMAWHVFDAHAKELKMKNIDDAIDFILSIINNVDHVRLGRDNSYIFSVEDGRSRVGRRAVTIVVNSKTGEFMGIRTSGYEDLKGLKERPLLWERGAHAAPEAAATPTVTTIKAQQGDEHVGRTEGQSNVSSDGKGSNFEGDTQEKGEKSLAQGAENTRLWYGTVDDAPATPTLSKVWREVLWENARDAYADANYRHDINAFGEGGPKPFTYGEEFIENFKERVSDETFEQSKPYLEAFFNHFDRLMTERVNEKKSQRANENEETPEAERQDLTTTIHSTSSDGAKVTISKDNAKSNLYRLAGQFVGVKSTKGFLAALSKALGLPDGEHKQSFYFEFADKAGNEYMLRISNHNVNAENSDGRVPEISIVIKSKRQPNRFHASDAQVQEYVYFKEDIAKGDGQTLTLIAQDIAAMLDSGKYDETSKLAVVNVSPKPEAPTTQAAVEAASAEVNTEPTQAQIEAGNYKKGHVQVGGFDITIENPAGSVRKGVDAGGKQWETTMHNAYGYFKGTEGADGDHIDVFLHENMDKWDGRKVFVVDQTKPDGTFDEHKVMLGFNDKDEAMAAYLSNYDATWAKSHPDLRISEVSMDEFKKWVGSSHRKTKPFADYAKVEKITDARPTENLFRSAGEAWTYRQEVAAQARKHHREVARRENTPELLRQLSDERLEARIAELEQYLPEDDKHFEKAIFFARAEDGERIPTRAELNELMDKREEAAAYLPGLWAERKRRADEDLIAKAKRITQQPVVPKPVKSIDLTKYVSTDPKRVNLSGVHYANGEATSTNGMVVISRKSDYPAEYEGSTRGKKGEAIAGKFPDYGRVLDMADEGRQVAVDVERLRYDVARALEAQKATGETVLVEIGRGRYSTCVAADNAKALLDAYDTAKGPAQMHIAFRDGAGELLALRSDDTRAVALPVGVRGGSQDAVVRDGIILRGSRDVATTRESLEADLQNPKLKPKERRAAEYKLTYVDNPQYERINEPAKNAKEARDDFRDAKYFDDDELLTAYDDYVARWGTPESAAKAEAEVAEYKDYMERKVEEQKAYHDDVRGKSDAELEETLSLDVPDSVDEYLARVARLASARSLQGRIGSGTPSQYELDNAASDIAHKLRARQELERRAAERQELAGEQVDNQGNPINSDGTLIIEPVNSVDEITDEDFNTPNRSVKLPQLPQVVSDALGADGRVPIIKKNIFGKNLKSHKDLSPEDSRRILHEALYNPSLYGQNQKATRPYNWILVHLADKNSAVVVEVNNPDKEHMEIVNWHYIGAEEIERKKRQAIKEGGLILTLPEDNAAANTLNSLFADETSADSESTINRGIQGKAVPTTDVSGSKGSTKSANKQAESEKTAAGPAVIEDFGEEIAGARKDLVKRWAKELSNVTERALAEQPLGKVFKRPTFKKAVESGAMTEDEARVAEALTSSIFGRRKPTLKHKSDLLAWVKDTYASIQRLNDFINGDAEQRRAVMNSLADIKPLDEAADREHFENVKALNPNWTPLEPVFAPDPVAVNMKLMERMDWTPGDKFELDMRIKTDRTHQSYYVEDAGGKRLYWIDNTRDLDKMIDTIATIMKMRRGDSDTVLRADWFRIRGVDPIMRPTGNYIVRYATSARSLNTTEKTFDSREAADAFAKEKTDKGLWNTVYAEEERSGECKSYKIVFIDPVKKEAYEVRTDLASKAEADQLIGERIEELSADAVSKYAEAHQIKPSKREHFRVTVSWDKDGKKYSVVNSDIKNPFDDPLVKSFATREEAEKWFAENKDALEKDYAEFLKQKRNFVFFDTSRSRRGEDYRHGEDVTPERFTERFGFRGVQFGNWTNVRDRQTALNEAYDAFMDLAKVLNVTPRALSLNGELGLAFGARGSGDALAHYEPMEVVINLTKTKGAGSLAHEWWHAMDNYFSRRDAIAMGYMTENTASRSTHLRGELVEAFRDLVKAVKGSEFDKRSNRHSRSSYWGSTIEETARLFAEWVNRELGKQGEANHFLSRGADSGTLERYQQMLYEYQKKLSGDSSMTFEQWREKADNGGSYPYPFDDEIDNLFSEPLRRLFDTMQVQKTDDGREVLFRRGEGVAPTERGEEAAASMLSQGVEVVHSLEELPRGSRQRKAIEAGEKVTGWYDPATGRAYVYAPNITSVDELSRSMRHEGIHMGVRELLGQEKFGQLCDRVWSQLMTDEERREFFAYANDMSVEDLRKLSLVEQAKLYADENARRAAADEFMAFSGEDGHYNNMSRWQKFTAWVKDILRKMFGDRIKVSLNDVMNLLRRSEKNLLNLQEERNKANETERAKTAGRDNDVERQADGSRVAEERAQAVSLARDRSDIRVLEEGLATERHGDSGDSERDRRAAESERLVKTAKDNGRYLTQEEVSRLGERKQKPSGESEVYIDQESGMVYKVKNPYAKAPMKHGVQPEDAIYEHVVHNLLFPETRYKFEGISDADGDVRMVLSQKFVKSYGVPTKAQIEAALARRGLKPECRYTYGNEYVTVTDVTGDNALLGADGEVYFIDPIIGFKRPVKDVIAGLSGGDTRLRFIGEKGAARLDAHEEGTARLDNLKVAREMEQAEKDAKAIKMATGWERGADGKWRYETADFRVKQESMPEDRAYALGEEVEKLYNEQRRLQGKIEGLWRVRDGFPGRNRTPEQKAKIKEIDKQLKRLLNERNKIESEYYEKRNKWKLADEGQVRLGELISEDNGLFDAYPELRNLPVRVEDLGSGTRGLTRFDGYSGDLMDISIHKDLGLEQVESVLNHEVQHTIQYFEGFAKGGNVDSYYEDSAEKAMHDMIVATNGELTRGGKVEFTPEGLREALERPTENGKSVLDNNRMSLNMVAETFGYDDILKMVDDCEKFKSAYAQYRNLAGEVESRNVQSRLEMPAEERRTSLAIDTEDVAREDQVVLEKMLGDKSAMGSRVPRRMKEIKAQLQDVELDDNQRAVVDAFTGERDNTRLRVEREDGARTIIMRQGSEGGAGTKHSIYRHYGTKDSYITPEDLLLLPDILRTGERSAKPENQKRITYSANINGVDYIVATDYKNGVETFVNFYSKRKPSITNASSPEGNTPEGARMSVEDFDGAKVRKNSESQEERGEKNADFASRYDAEDGRTINEGIRFRTSKEIERDYPNWLDGTTTDSGKHSTQVEGTRKTYNKVGDWIEKNLGKDVSVLDASSGMGYGTADLRGRGFNIEDVEPYQSEERKANNPATYDSYDKIGKKYDYIISNAVLNVIPDDWRADVLHNMAAALNDGGRMFINTRRAGEERSIKDKIELDSPSEVLVKRNGKIASYQRFFTPAELKEWVESELGDGYSVEIANEKNSGTKGLAAVVVTKNNESLAKSEASGLGQPIAEADAPMVKVDAKVAKNREFAKNLEKLNLEIAAGKTFGAHELLYRIARGLGYKKQTLNKSAYFDLDGNVSLRVADHQGNARTFALHNHADDNLGLVIKLSPSKFKDRESVNYLELVFYPDKIADATRQREIIEGLQKYLTTGDVGHLPRPDKYNGSGMMKPEAEKLNTELRQRESDEWKQGMAQTSEGAKKEHAEQLARKLNTPMRIVTDLNELTHSDPEVQAAMRRNKGIFDAKSGEVIVVLPNNRDVADVAETVFHEVVAHRGLREMVGEDRYDAFCDEVYDHLKDDLQGEVERDATRRFMKDPERGYESARREAVDELFGRLSEKGFEDFTRAERSIWQKLKTKVLEVINRFLESMKLPKWVTLGDNELRYMLWRSHERLTSKGDMVDMARDAAKRSELGLDKGSADYNRAQSERAELQRVNATFNRAAQKVEQGESVGRISLGHTPSLLKQLGVKSDELILREAVLRSHLSKHDLTAEDIQDLPEALQKPIMVYTWGEKAKSMIVVTNIPRGDQRITVAVKLERNGREVEVNEIASVHGKDIERVLAEMNTDKSDFGKDNLKYVDKKRAAEWLDLTPPEGADVRTVQQQRAAKIVESFENPMVSEEKYLYREGETDDIWKDGSVGMEERITNAAIRLSQRQSDDRALRNDAMRAIGGNLTSLRRAMAAQKRYDQATVKRVSDLAKVLMQTGLLSNIKDGEMQRLLSAVKNSVGHENLQSSVDAIMDIMVNNQLRNGENAMNQLLTIRGSKVDAAGVEVQGVLDVDGQRTMEVLKRAKGLSEAEINDRMEEAMSNMSDPAKPIADQAALEYAGLDLALDYVQNIKMSQDEEHTLRSMLKEAKAEKDAGRMTAEAYKQFAESIQENIRKNKIERAEAYFNLVGRISNSLRESIENAKAFREAEKERVQRVHHFANSDMEGRPCNEHHKDDWKDKWMNGDLAQFFFAPLRTFEQMLRVFGNKSANGEGYLWNRFMRGWNDCREQELTGIEKKFAQLDAKAAEIFGKGATWGSIIRKEGSLPKATVSFMDGGEMREHELTQGNLLYIYMVDKMADGRMKLRRMGITEDDMARIESALDPRMKQLGDWLQEEFLVETRNGYNETHKRVFGASMAAIENYFPLKILANARTDKEEDVNNSNRSDGITTRTGSIIKRRVNNLALDITGADALNVVLDHVTEMEHWNAFAEWNRDLNTLRTYKRFRNQVINMTAVYGGGRQLWENFNDICKLAAGEYRPPVAKLDKTMVNIGKGVTAAKVSFRIFTALKQMLSAPAYASEVSTASIAKSIANPYASFKWCLENLPIFRERWRSRISGDPRLLKSEMDWKMWRSRAMELASRVGMTPNAFVDAVTVSIGAKAIYETRLKQYLREGYPKEMAEKRARQDATILYNQTQQSSEAPFLSTLQVDRSWASVMWTVFRNSAMSYTRQEYDALRNLKRNLTPGQRQKSIAFMAKQILRDWELNPDDAPEEKAQQAYRAAKKRFNRQLKKDVIRTATFGYIIQLVWNLGPYLPYLFIGNNDDDKKKMWDDALTHALFGSVEGLTGGDVMSAFGNMAASGEWNTNQLTKDMPIASDINAIIKKYGSSKTAEATNDLINLIVQSGIGMNPQSITDTAVAIMDACGDDPELSHETALFVMRVLQVPQSQLDNIYFDEVDLSGEEASKYTPKQLAKRYATYKVMRGTPLAPWSWDDEARIEKYEAGAKKLIKERVAAQSDSSVLEAYGEMKARHDAISKRVSDARAEMKKPNGYIRGAEKFAEVQADPDFSLYRRFEQMNTNLAKVSGMLFDAETPEEAQLITETIDKYRAGMVKALQATDPGRQSDLQDEVMDIWSDFIDRYWKMHPGEGASK
jgi:hypothetical protein